MVIIDQVKAIGNVEMAQEALKAYKVAELKATTEILDINSRGSKVELIRKIVECVIGYEIRSRIMRGEA